MTNRPKMRLWLLRPNEPLGWGCAEGFVILAISDVRAREIATEFAGDEDMVDGKQGAVGFWKDSRRSSCEVLVPKGKEGLVIRDFHYD